jgi:hypothetical protein
MYVPEALWDHRKDSHEAARKTAKPPPVTESPIGALLGRATARGE